MRGNVSTLQLIVGSCHTCDYVLPLIFFFFSYYNSCCVVAAQRIFCVCRAADIWYIGGEKNWTVHFPFWVCFRVDHAATGSNRLTFSINYYITIIWCASPPTGFFRSDIHPCRHPGGDIISEAVSWLMRKRCLRRCMYCPVYLHSYFLHVLHRCACTSIILVQQYDSTTSKYAAL